MFQIKSAFGTIFNLPWQPGVVVQYSLGGKSANWAAAVYLALPQCFGVRGEHIWGPRLARQPRTKSHETNFAMKARHWGVNSDAKKGVHIGEALDGDYTLLDAAKISPRQRLLEHIHHWTLVQKMLVDWLEVDDLNVGDITTIFISRKVDYALMFFGRSNSKMYKDASCCRQIRNENRSKSRLCLTKLHTQAIIAFTHLSSRLRCHLAHQGCRDDTSQFFCGPIVGKQKEYRQTIRILNIQPSAMEVDKTDDAIGNGLMQKILVLRSASWEVYKKCIKQQKCSNRSRKEV